jgi:hypothetical protein
MFIAIDRRELLRLGLLAAASAQLAPLQSWSFTPQALPHAASQKKVLVVGVGLPLGNIMSSPQKHTVWRRPIRSRKKQVQ